MKLGIDFKQCDYDKGVAINTTIDDIGMFDTRDHKSNRLRKLKSPQNLVKKSDGIPLQTQDILSPSNLTNDGTHSAERTNRPYIKPWTIIKTDNGLLQSETQDHQQPSTLLDQMDYEKRLQFDHQKKMRLENMCQWKKNDKKGSHKSNYIRDIQKKTKSMLIISDKNDLEKLEVYTDRFPLLKLRKSLLKVYHLIKMTCFMIINNKIFDNICLLVIIANSVTMIFDDSASSDNPNPIFAVLENIFLILYTIEMGFKIVGYGFIMGPDAYIKDSWNVLDFFIVMSSYVTIISERGHVEQSKDQPGAQEEEASVSIAGLRVFRVMRPLKTISSIKGLKVLIVAVLSALPMLQDTLMILMFFFIIFAIATTQMFNGMLKQRCIAIQTGINHPDDIICNVNDENSCPGGYFCGKGSENPNYGVTNFDNIAYSILAVFQCLTLEGWSEIQRDMQRSFTTIIYLMFIPMVLIGAFFLLNLTLAVINSKFTEMNNKQQQQDQIELKQSTADNGEDGSKEDDNQMSIHQFVQGRLYSKKMIEFLRMRQQIKQIEKLRIQKAEQQKKNKTIWRSKSAEKEGRESQKQQNSNELVSIAQNNKQAYAKIKKQGIKKPEQIKLNIKERWNSMGVQSQANGNNNSVILEDVHGEELGPDLSDGSDYQSGQPKLDYNVQEFLEQGKIDMQRSGTNAKNFKIPKNLNKKIRKDIGGNFPRDINLTPIIDENNPLNQHILPPKTNILQLKRANSGRKIRSSLDLALEFDIDKVIPNKDSNDHKIEHNSIDSFKLSQNNKTYGLNNSDSHTSFLKGSSSAGLVIPGMHPPKDEESGLITSDSDFEDAVPICALCQQNKNQKCCCAHKTNESRFEIGAKNNAKIISKKFKKMLTYNFRNNYTTEEQKELSEQTTKIGGSKQNHDETSRQKSLEIENKFISKQNMFQKASMKIYKEDKLSENALVDEFAHVPKIGGLKCNSGDNHVQNLKQSQLWIYTNPISTAVPKQQIYRPTDDVRQLIEFVSEINEKTKEPFRDINLLTQKVEIAKNQKYFGTSQHDVFQTRKSEKELNQPMLMNQFLKKPDSIWKQEDDFVNNEAFRERFQFWPYQQKFIYKVPLESSDPEEESLNEDEIQAEEQPFYTPSRVNYYHQTKQLYTRETMKRSDMMITSTLSMSLFPKDKRQIDRVIRTKLIQDQIDEFIDNKCAFNALLKEHNYQTGHVREKDCVYNQNYQKSFFHRAEFQSNTLSEFKQNVLLLNKNKKVPPKKPRTLIKAEQLKHDQNVRNSEKRGIPTFDMEMALKLLEGKFHEESSDDDEHIKDKLFMYRKIQEQRQLNFEEANVEMAKYKFQEKLRHIFDQNEDKLQIDEIPIPLRNELNIPVDIGDNQIDFQQVRKHDASKKKVQPTWSGHEVLGSYMDNYKALWIIKQINRNRVWPTGLKGVSKRISFVLRLHVKSESYDNFFTFFVFLNTITLALNRYGMNPDLEEFLELTNTYFTYIFIYEMFMKIAGIGIKKYLNDTMNYMDGLIVMASIFELLYVFIGDGADQSALSTLRVLRAVRVFRMLRLLRNLESMQTILNVMARSYMSFVYITGLMFLFIIIFTLLGMSTYGGYWKNDPLGLPPNNFDSFGYAFFTQFQVLTMENWQTVLFVQMRNNKTVTEAIQAPCINILWICLGNFILLNLFLAILLDSFLVDGEDLSEQEIEEIKLKKKARKLAKKQRLERRQVKMNTKEIKKITLTPMLVWWNGQEKLPSDEDLEDLDEDQVIQIFKSEGYLMKDENELRQQVLFAGVACKQSFFIFSKENPIRIICYKAIKHRYWEKTVLFAICMSSLKLAYDSFYIAETQITRRSEISSFMDSFFSIAFIIEMSVKLIALGFCMDVNSYLQDEWNQMDFFIVTASIFDMALSGYDLAALKILRMLRVLRPLRFLTHNVGLKLIVNALIESLNGIVNVLIVVAVVYLIFAIMGVNFYSGKFFYCSIDTYVLNTKKDCEYAGGEWSQHDHNFDHVGRGWLTMFIVASLEGWPDIMIQAVESSGIDKGPKQNQSTMGPQLFFVIFIFIGSFFFLNFFIGVLFMKFNKAQEQEQKGFTQRDLSWMDIQKLILQAEPDYDATNIPESQWRKMFHRLVSSTKFEAFIMGTILLNMFQMGLLFEGMPLQMFRFLKMTNYIFAAIFIIEAILKLIAYGISYFYNSWNKFDFFVVAASILDLILELLGGQSGGFLNVTRVMRVLRVTRILRLAGRAKNLQTILQTITFSIPALGNVFILLMLIYFMMAVLANFVFFPVIDGEVIDPEFKNFRDIQASFILLFALSTGEDWNKVMFDCSRNKLQGCVDNINCGSAFAFLFFPGLIIICSYVMLNLFILVIIQQFEKYYLPEENMLEKFKQDLQTFMKVWRELTQDRYKCLKIKENQLTSFFRKLGAENDSLGFYHEKYDDSELKKYVLKMAIKSDNGFVFFNEMLYRCMRRKYGNMKINKKMQIFELRTQFQIFMMTLNVQNKSGVNVSNEDIYNRIIKKESGVNPFLKVMNFKISFKTWLKAARAELDQCSHRGQPPALQNYCQVEIEVEDLKEYTSEEEIKEERLTPSRISSAKSNTKDVKDPMSKYQQEGLAYFETKMRQKVQKYKQIHQQDQQSPLNRAKTFTKSNQINQKLKTRQRKFSQSQSNFKITGLSPMFK